MHIALIVIIIIAIIVLLAFVLKNKDDIFVDYDKKERERAGKLGENIVAKRLDEIAKNIMAIFIFKDRYNDNYSTEIDHILITRGGVFIIETKYNTGIIYGTENDEEWVCFKQGNIKNKTLKNHLKQNQTHIKCLKKMFSNTPPKMISMVVFLGGDITSINSNEIYNLDAAIEVIEYLTK